MHEELELKLAVTPEDLERLRGDALVQSLGCRQASTKRLFSTYYDTPSHELRRRGISLRVRDTGENWLQTVKLPGKGTSGLQHHREHEATVEGNAPEIARIEDGALRRMFDEEGLTPLLKPVFTTRFDRTSVPLKIKDGEVELPLDRGEIIADGQSLPICEAELELVSGKSQHIYELALDFHERITFRLETRTKGARGYHLVTGFQPSSYLASVPALTADMTVRDAFVVAAQSILAHVRLNETAVLLGRGRPNDTEGIHQLLLGVRRLSVLAGTFKPVLSREFRDFVDQELAWLRGVLEEVRPRHVLIHDILPRLRRRVPDDPALPPLCQAAKIRAKLATEALEAALISPRYTEFLLKLQLWLESDGWTRGDERQSELNQDIESFASHKIARQEKKLLKLIRKGDALSESKLRKVHTRAQGLRHLLECFQSLRPETWVRLRLAVVGQVQEGLALFKDGAIMETLLAELNGPTLESAVALVRGWQAASIERDLADLPKAFKALEKMMKG